MTDTSRRSFLKKASVGAAAAGAVAVAPTALSGSADAATADHGADAGAAHDGPFAVWVKDARSGELAVLVGEQEIVHTDKRLARQLARLAARAHN